MRQPLQTLLVRASQPGANEGLRAFEDELRDELNVKRVQYLEGSAGLVAYRFKPNLRVVGKKYGKRVPALRAALEALRGQAALEAGRLAEAGQPFTLMLDGESMEVQPDEVIVETSAPEGYAVAEDGGVLVALDTTLTPELRLEGAARDLVRTIQDARKEAGLEIADRITLYLEGADGVGALLRQIASEHGAVVQAETLATELILSSAPSGAFQAEAVLDGETLVIGIVRT